MNLLEAARITFKVRILLKTLKNAQRNKCNWVGSSAVNTSAIQSLASEHPCYNATMAIIRDAQNLPPGKRDEALRTTMSVPFPSTCMPTAHQDKDAEHHAEEDADERAEELAETVITFQ